MTFILGPVVAGIGCLGFRFVFRPDRFTTLLYAGLIFLTLMLGGFLTYSMLYKIWDIQQLSGDSNEITSGADKARAAAAAKAFYTFAGRLERDECVVEFPPQAVEATSLETIHLALEDSNVDEAQNGRRLEKSMFCGEGQRCTGGARKCPGPGADQAKLVCNQDVYEDRVAEWFNDYCHSKEGQDVSVFMDRCNECLGSKNFFDRWFIDHNDEPLPYYVKHMNSNPSPEYFWSNTTSAFAFCRCYSRMVDTLKRHAPLIALAILSVFLMEIMLLIGVCVVVQNTEDEDSDEEYEVEMEAPSWR